MALPSPKAIAQLKEEFCLEIEGDILVIIWHRTWNRVTGNPNGVTGWATVVRSLNGEVSNAEVGHAVLLHYIYIYMDNFYTYVESMFSGLGYLV